VIFPGFYAAQIQSFDDDNIPAEKHEVRGMAFGFELVDGKIVDAHQLDAAFDEKFRGFRLEIDEVLVKAGVIPVPGVLGFEKNSADAGKVQFFETGTGDGRCMGDFKDRGGSEQSFERNLVEGPTAFDHVPGGIDVRAGVRTHFDFRDAHGMAIVAREVRGGGKVDGRVGGPDRYGASDGNGNVVDHGCDLRNFNLGTNDFRTAAVVRVGDAKKGDYG